MVSPGDFCSLRKTPPNIAMSSSFVLGCVRECICHLPNGWNTPQGLGLGNMKVGKNLGFRSLIFKSCRDHFSMMNLKVIHYYKDYGPDGRLNNALRKLMKTLQFMELK
jgi:hypothetical protein